MTGNGSIQQRLLLTVSRIGNRQTFVAAWSLSCRHIEDKVSVLDPLTRLGAVVVSAILTCAITHATHLARKRQSVMFTTVSTRLDSTHIQMLVGHLHLPAHGRRLAVIDAMGVAVLHIHLGTVALAVG